MPKITKILIVEDDVFIADYLFEMLQSEGFLCVEIANTSKDAMLKIKTFEPEILILDIAINGKNIGIELAKKNNSTAKIIYITAQNDTKTIQKAIETKPENYLTKPIKKIDLILAINLILIKLKATSINIKDGFTDVILNFDDILYIKSENIYIDIYTKSKKYTIRKSLDAFLSELNNEQFCRIHRSYIVNKKNITEKTARYVLVNTTQIPLSRGFILDI